MDDQVVSLRRATSHDVDILLELNAIVQGLHAQAFPELFYAEINEERVRKFYLQLLSQPKEAIVVASVQGRDVGYVWGRKETRPENPFRRAMTYFYIHQIAVRLDHEGHGVGKALMAAMVSSAQLEGCSWMELDAWNFNQRAQQFFLRQNFQIYNSRFWRKID
jgi:ribosomal protein S18 acetylase RimI-like enzyme